MSVKNSPLVESLAQLEAHLQHYLATLAERTAPYRRELLGGGLLFFSLIALLNLFGLSRGILPEALGGWSRGLFGWWAIPAVLLAAVAGGFILAQRLKPSLSTPPLESIIGFELAFLAALAVTHIVSGGSAPLLLAREQGGGGFIGWALSILLADMIGQWLAGFIFLLLGLAGIGLMLRYALSDFNNDLPAFEPLAPASAFKSQPLPPAKPLAIITEPPAPAPPKPAPKPKTKIAQKSWIEALRQPSPQPAKQQGLPPLTLLAPSAEMTGEQADARYQAQIIEDTLLGFGIPAQVVEINTGPTVTQFGLTPGTLEKKMPDGRIIEQRIRVRKISALVNDLALALAAAPIRIETPVPGRPIVGIEVPNSVVSMVGLRGAMETGDFWTRKGVLKVPVGRGVSGEVAVIDLTQMPHLLIAGATGSGKSVCINAIITSLLLTHTPETLRLLLIDPKMVELTAYNGIPHLIAPVVTDFEQVAGALAWATREMERRYKAFAGVGARSITSYNQKVAPDEQLPYQVVIIDELADLMMLAADDVEHHICRIAQMARATGIHLIIATQRPSTDVVTGLIKANFPARIAFAVSSQIDSRVIIDSPGAENLLGRGDMLFMAPDSAQLARLQGCFVSDAEINQVVEFWRRTPAQRAEPLPETPQEMPWADILEAANRDDMFEEAVRVVVQEDRASITMLQRKLGIGYPRASRLMDQLEQEGVVGPAEGNNAREVWWTGEAVTLDDEAHLP